MQFTENRFYNVTLAGIVIITLCCGMTFFLGLPHASIYGHDIFVYLDGSWRVLQGQRPHADFYTPIGAVFYLLGAAGLRLAYAQVDGLPDSIVFSAAVIGLWSLALIRSRLTGLRAVLALAFLLFFWVAPFPLGDPYYEPSYAMLYNRLGYVLTALIVIELFTPCKEIRTPIVDWGALSTGLALGLLLFVKASFFTVALGIIAVSIFLKLTSSRRALFVLAGFLLVCCCMFTYLRWDVGAFLRDLQIAAGARQRRFNPVKDLLRVPLRNVTPIAALLALVLFGQKYVNSAATRSSSLLRCAPWFALLVLGADLVLALSNQQRYGFPLTVVAILLIVDQMVVVSSDEKHGNITIPFATTTIAVIIVLPFIFDTVNAWAIQPTVRANTSLTTAARVNSPVLKDLVFDDHVDSVWDQRERNGHYLVGVVNDGLALLRAKSGANDRVACLCMTNPFSYALERRPPAGGSPVFDYGTDFTERFTPPAERILGGAEIVMYPKREKDSQTVATLLKICQPLLSKHYAPLAESAEWVALRKID